MAEIKDIKNLVAEETGKHGGIRNALKQSKQMQQDRILLSCDPDTTTEIRTIIERIGLHLDEQKQTDPRGIKLLDMPPVSMIFRTTMIEPLIEEIQTNWTPGERKRLAIVINKAYKTLIETTLKTNGWTLEKEITYPFFGGVQTWTKERQ